MLKRQISERIRGGFLLSSLLFFAAACLSHADDLKGYFLGQDTFFYLYTNVEKVRMSKIYSSVEKYIIRDYYTEYLKLRVAAEKIGIKEEDISEIYFSAWLKDVKTITNITQDGIHYLSGIVLRKDINDGKLFGILKESLKNEPSISLNKIKQGNNEIIIVKGESGSTYITIPQSKLILTSSDLSKLVSLLDSYNAGKPCLPSSRISELLLQIPSLTQLYAVIAVPPFMTKELQQVSSKVKRSEQQDFKHRVNDAIKNLFELTIEAKTEDTLALKIGAFFDTKEEAKSFNEFLAQFVPLIKFQLFMMVQNSTLPVLNTITAGMTNKSVSLSGVLTSDDLASINQMIKKGFARK